MNLPSPSACPLCANATPATVRRMAAGHVYRCRGCGLVFFWPPPVQDSPSAGVASIATHEGYTEQMLVQAPTRHRRQRQLAAHRHRLYSRHLGRARYRLLEVGCGVAELGPHLAELGVDYHGIDIDHRCVTVAQQQPSICVTEQDLFALDPKERFDVVVFSQVLEHVTAPVAFIAKVHAHLVDGGLVHGDVPNHHSLAGLLASIGVLPNKLRYGELRYPHHLFSYPKRALRRLLEPGFEVSAFTTTFYDRTWGGTQHYGTVHRGYAALSRLLRRPNLLVAFGRKRPGGWPRVLAGRK